MLDIGFILLLAAWSAGVGLRVLGRLRQTPEHPADALALAVPLGLGMLALAALVLGEFGALTPGGLRVVLVAGALLGGREAGRGIACLVREAPFPEPRSPDLPFLIVSAAALVGTLITALTPVTDGDALCYHLQVPKLFLERGAVAFEPDLHETVYPLVTELLYAVALTFRGPVACRLVQWVLGLAFAANVTAVARPSLGPRAWWAGAIALLVPAVSNGMSAPLNDVALAAFAAAALACWSRFHQRPGARSAAATGLFTGLALGVKYPALVLAGLIGTAITARTFRPDRGPGTRIKYKYFKYIYSAIALAVGGVWYLRAFVHTGNPVYPFFRQAFGGAGLDEVLDPIKRPMPVTPWNLLTALGPLTLQPDRF
ncbi:MAG: glycosyltransferase family 39 protein, partial [Singulisphaera sp.]|nr:glycosyltransferase family 39 protein [Singulisphaera sp.]